MTKTRMACSASSKPERLDFEQPRVQPLVKQKGWGLRLLFPTKLV